MIKSYTDLDVYNSAYRLALQIHSSSLGFPKFETYELGGQLRRAAISIPLNIAEGYGKKKSSAEFRHFLSNAMGSCNEVSVLIEMCKDLGYFDEEVYTNLSNSYDVLGKRINKLIQT